jgi:hypothetical protein
MTTEVSIKHTNKDYPSKIQVLKEVAGTSSLDFIEAGQEHRYHLYDGIKISLTELKTDK